LQEFFRQKGREVENPLLYRFKTVDGKRYQPVYPPSSPHSSTLPQGEATVTTTPPNLATGPTGQVEEEAMEAEMDETMVAGMEEDLESLEFISYTPVRLIVYAIADHLRRTQHTGNALCHFTVHAITSAKRWHRAIWQYAQARHLPVRHSNGTHRLSGHFAH